METIEMKMASMKDELEKTLKGFQVQLSEKKALHTQLSKKAARMMDGEYNIEVYEKYTNLGIEKHQLECDMELLKFQIESTEMYIDQTNKIIEKL